MNSWLAQPSAAPRGLCLCYTFHHVLILCCSHCGYFSRVIYQPCLFHFPNLNLSTGMLPSQLIDIGFGWAIDPKCTQTYLSNRAFMFYAIKGVNIWCNYLVRRKPVVFSGSGGRKQTLLELLPLQALRKSQASVHHNSTCLQLCLYHC